MGQTYAVLSHYKLSKFLPKTQLNTFDIEGKDGRYLFINPSYYFLFFKDGTVVDYNTFKGFIKFDNDKLSSVEVVYVPVAEIIGLFISIISFFGFLVLLIFANKIHLKNKFQDAPSYVSPILSSARIKAWMNHKNFYRGLFLIGLILLILLTISFLFLGREELAMFSLPIFIVTYFLYQFLKIGMHDPVLPKLLACGIFFFYSTGYALFVVIKYVSPDVFWI